MEVVLALGILAFSIFTVIGLLGTAMNSNVESEERLGAANLATLLLTQYREKLADTAGGGTASPLPNLNAIESSIPNGFGNPEPIGLNGETVNDDEASFALSSSVWEDDRFPADAPYRLIKCAIRLEWPAQIALAAGNSTNRNVSTYTATTAFLIVRK